MKWVLMAAVLNWIFAWWCNRAVDRTGDDFGSAFFVLFFMAVAGVLSLIYVLMVFWNHRFPW